MIEGAALDGFVDVSLRDLPFNGSPLIPQIVVEPATPTLEEAVSAKASTPDLDAPPRPSHLQTPAVELLFSAKEPDPSPFADATYYHGMDVLLRQPSIDEHLTNQPTGVSQDTEQETQKRSKPCHHEDNGQVNDTAGPANGAEAACRDTIISDSQIVEQKVNKKKHRPPPLDLTKANLYGRLEQFKGQLDKMEQELRKMIYEGVTVEICNEIMKSLGYDMDVQWYGRSNIRSGHYHLLLSGSWLRLQGVPFEWTVLGLRYHI